MKKIRSIIFSIIGGVLIVVVMYLWMFSLSPVGTRAPMNYLRSTNENKIILIESSGNLFLVKVGNETKAFFCHSAEGSGFFETIFYMADIECNEITLDEYQLITKSE